MRNKNCAFQVNKKIDNQEKEVAEADANLRKQKKMWNQREEWDPFLADKLGRKKEIDQAKKYEVCFPFSIWLDHRRLVVCDLLQRMKMRLPGGPNLFNYFILHKIV